MPTNLDTILRWEYSSQASPNPATPWLPGQTMTVSRQLWARREPHRRVARYGAAQSYLGSAEVGALFVVRQESVADGLDVDHVLVDGSVRWNIREWGPADRGYIEVLCSRTI